MENLVLKSRVSLRNDTASNWQTSNPKLLKGEVGLEIDTLKFKIGDGTNFWNSLPYANITVDEFNDAIASIRNIKVLKYDKDEFEKLPEKDVNTLYLLV